MTGMRGLLSRAFTTSGTMEGAKPISPVTVVANFKKSLRLTPWRLNTSQKVSIVYLHFLA